MLIISKSEKETEKIAAKMSKKLRGGEVVALIGNLGSGKTVFVRGLAKGLGIKKIITSPSFILMKVYKIKNRKLKLQSKIKNLVHVDAYRLSSSQDLIDIGLKDWLGKSDIITVIEWAERVKKILPKKTIEIKIKFGGKKNGRVFHLLDKIL